MSLLVPPEFARAVNKYSGYIGASSPHAKKNLKGLFLSPENRRYLARQVYLLITHEEFVRRNIYDLVGREIASNTVKLRLMTFRTKRQFLEQCIPQMMEVHVLPYAEEIMINNPVMQLHRVNNDFMLNTARNIIQNPDMLVPRFYDINPETGVDESQTEYDFTSASYADGTWHPEHLFTNSAANKRSGYWTPLDVSFYTDDDNTGLGHKYYNNGAYTYTDYGNQRSRAAQGLSVNEGSGLGYQGGPRGARESMGSGSSARPARVRQGIYFPDQKTRAQVPRWQDAGAHRPYERDIDEGLDEGGHSDRRVQGNRGYNMLPLTSKSTY
jgi:hypothetical protein